METEPTSSANGGVFDQRYEILGELGSGSSGRVVRARQLSTGQCVAIKLLNQRERGRQADRFRRETRICAALSHTNVVRLIDAGETRDGQLFAVFEYVPGETLAEVLARDGNLEVRESLRLMTQVLDALAAAHAQGIVHRDLKPANLMLSGTGARRNALVLDFGLGGLDEGLRGRQWQMLTQTREFLGTPLYAAPEQLAGEPATPRSDLYAWGLVFLECLTGRHPFEQQGAAARLFTGGGPVEIPAWLRDHRLGTLLEAVTTPEAEKRDLSVASLIEALDEIAAGGELPVAPAEPARPRPLAESGERRHLTVLFCDLVDSTGLAQRLGLEAYRRVVVAYHASGADVVTRYGGHVAQRLGDGLLAYFGHPVAHEDDAERAVRAGRELVREIRRLNPALESQHGVRISARVGIHSGLVVVGEIGAGDRAETLAVGDTPTIASRLQAVAEPDTVVISEATLRLVAGIFVTEDRGTPELKGISGPIRVHRVLHPSGIASPLDRMGALTPFVGREQELELLLDRFEQAQEGQGQAAWVSGEAGIGKSRLLHRFRQSLEETPHTWLECRCSPYTQNTAFQPLVAMLEQGLRFEGKRPEGKLARLERGLALVGLGAPETVQLVASLLSLDRPDRPIELSPRLQREKTLEALLAWLLASSEKQPLVLQVEDLHWADPSTLEWLGLVIEQCATAGVLVLLTFRPHFEPPWPRREHVLPIVLGRLRRRETRAMVAGAVGPAALSDAVVEEIAGRSDGIPLFVEELAKGVVESGLHLESSVSDLEIPQTLQDSLMARLDRLGRFKPVAQLGSALGREFSYELLEAVAPLEQSALREGLGHLVEAELAYQRGLPPTSTYTFKHALVQDAAYESLLEGQRRELHGRIADALEQRFSERVAREPELLARHLHKAGRIEEAVAQYRRAAEGASQRFAQAEAIGHLREAITLLGALASIPEREQEELELQVALGSAIFAAQGGWHPDAERAYRRALELCRDEREPPELIRALVGLSLFHFEAGEVKISCELATQALVLADRGGEVYSRLVANTRLGITLLFLGELPRSLEHLERAVALYDPAEHRALAGGWGQDWGAIARCFTVVARWASGYPERARRLMSEAVAQAREGDPYSLSFALAVGATMNYLFGDRARSADLAREAMAIAEEQGFPIVLMLAGVYRGTALGGAKGLAEIQESIRRAASVGLPTIADWYRELAEVHLEAGRTREALAAVEGGLGVSSEVVLNHSRLHHTRGRILLETGDLEGAERSFRSALEYAREQHAKLPELMAATSLARLLRDRGEAESARALLRPVYAWFTEGFGTPVLREAKALLDELG